MVAVQLLRQRGVRVVANMLQLRFHRGAQQRRVHKLLALFEHIQQRLLCAGSNCANLKAEEEEKGKWREEAEQQRGYASCHIPLDLYRRIGSKRSLGTLVKSESEQHIGSLKS